MKKFAEICLYNQCIIFIAAARPCNRVNANVLMMWQKTQTFTLKSVLYFLFEPAAQFSLLVLD